MELTFMWFWIVKLFIALLALVTIYLAFRAKGKNWLWNILTIIWILFYIMLPIKMEPTTSKVNQQTNYQIAERKVELPEKVEDNSFKSKAKSIEESSIMDKEIK